MSDLKSKFLALRATVPSEQVTVPGVGVVTMRGLTAAKRDEWEQRIWNAKGKSLTNIRASLVAWCAYDGEAPLFSASDIDAIGEMPASIIDELYDIATRLSGMGAKDKEAIEGNSASAR